MAQYASAAMMMGRNQEWAASQDGQQYLANSYQMAAAAGAAHPAAQQVIWQSTHVATCREVRSTVWAHMPMPVDTPAVHNNSALER